MPFEKSRRTVEQFQLSESDRPSFGAAVINILPPESGEPIASFTVEIAKTPFQQVYGLSFVKSLPENQGMLFLYNTPRRVAFWMKNTFIPLDILFLDENFEVVQIKRSAQPHDETLIPSEKEIMAVLEINARLARKLGIRSGCRIVINSI